ncbi:helix-turn-helix domain-containing protein [Oscillatoria salina]|uniref:helix-turn-helix domain-containing protein n=1 Tax=Oscillatoria salina TaxID=331517 RepID=UPI0013BAF38C|nr:helix-turn-helix transcriptional regulator [Oscillatoria salina]MBZ8178581.1 helix-turn-helix transcriptional regulator [Oscillatoria salina IIICB1]NET87330.1 helix-turn-helix transcriptional regulator [Kamptonema sp. SIO1D9]
MTDDILAKFGKCLRKARLDKRLSQEQLAEIVDLDRTYISLLERGKRNPSLLCIASLCEALDISIAEFFTKMKSDRLEN